MMCLNIMYLVFDDYSEHCVCHFLKKICKKRKMIKQFSLLVLTVSMWTYQQIHAYTDSN